MTLEALGLMYVKDTFVGDENVRGVSGGQRRRVTLGEVRLWDVLVICTSRNYVLYMQVSNISHASILLDESHFSNF
jgi:hypothetical protein